MSTGMIVELGERPAATVVGTQLNGREEDTEKDSEQLIPGIPNDITVNHIFPKLLTVLSPILSLVSSSWRKVIRSDEVCNARARWHATETLVVLNHNGADFGNGIVLYSMRDESCYQLPAIPGFQSRIPWSCQCISLDRKLYVIGGEGDLWGEGVGEDVDENDRGVEVYVLDLAGSFPLEWKPCADMLKPRKEFGCGVKDGKVYVFGGTCPLRNPLCECEVYDPQENSWSSLPPMKTERFGHHVARIGEEFAVYGGCGFVANVDEAISCQDWEFYHPGKNEWRVVDPFRKQNWDIVFTAQEKFYALTSRGIYVHGDDIEKDSWTEVHSFSLPTITSYSELYESCPVLAVNGELLTLSHRHNSVTDRVEFCLLRSNGFGSKAKELVWEIVNSCLSFDLLRLVADVLESTISILWSQRMGLIAAVGDANKIC